MLRLHSVHWYPIPHVHMDGSFIQKANNLPSNLVKHPFSGYLILTPKPCMMIWHPTPWQLKYIWLLKANITGGHQLVSIFTLYP